MAYQYGPCGKRRTRQPKPEFPKPTLDDLRLAEKDIEEVGWDCAMDWSRYVVEYFERN